MTKLVRTLAACGAALWLAAPASAQLPYSQVPNYRPGYTAPLSPYLNFLRGGDPASNYFLGVIPEIQRRNNAAQFRQSIDLLRQRQDLMQSQLTGPDADLITPGTLMGQIRPTFLNTGGFYQPGVVSPLATRTPGRPGLYGQPPRR